MRLVLTLALLLLANRPSVNAQLLLSENFENGIPSTWTLIDNDGLTPDPNTAFVTDAWTITPTAWTGGIPGVASDSSITSTSWYTDPNGTADDWIISPAVSLTSQTLLQWRARAADQSFPDGYEVRISTTTPTIAGFLANPPLFSIPGESNNWVQRSVDLDQVGYQNQTVYIAWRNNSTYQNTLSMDEFYIFDFSQPYPDISASFGPDLYTSVPRSQVNGISALGIMSTGPVTDVTNASMQFTVLDPTQNQFYTESSPTVPLITAGNSSSHLFNLLGAPTPSVSGDYTFEVTASIQENDINPANNTFTHTVTFHDSVYARDNGTITGVLGTYNHVEEWGNVYDIYATDSLTSVTFYSANTGGINQPYIANVYQYDTTTNTPGTLIAQSDTMIHPNQVDFYLTTPFSTPIELTPGNYLVTIKQLAGNFNLGLASGNFTNNRHWYRNTTAGWGWWSQPYTYMVRANFGTNCYPTESLTPVTVCDSFNYTSANGSFTWSTSGMYTDTLVNANGCDSIARFDLTILNSSTNSPQPIASCGPYTYTSQNGTSTWSSSGIYTDTLTNMLGCDSVLYFDLTINTATTSTTDATICSGDSFTWTDGNTYSTAGAYTQTLTNSVGCDSVATLNLTVDNPVDVTITNNSPTLTANQSGATYQWIDCGNGNAAIPGETNQSFTAQSNGNYAVIVTVNNCSDTSACTPVNGLGIISLEDLDAKIYPNPTSGTLYLHFNKVHDDIRINIKNALGQIVERTEHKNVKQIKLSIEDEPGMYFVEIEQNGITHIVKIIKR